MLASPSSKPPTAELRALRLEYLRRLEQRNEPLLSYIPRVSPHLLAPQHLAPLARLFERIVAGERVRALVDIPAQHGKTTTCAHGLPYILGRRPTWPLAYVTFSQQQAERKSLDAQRVALAAGALDPRADRITLEEWRNPRGGGCLFTGIGGGLGGNPARVLIFDDFFKNREEAESKHRRDAVADWITSVAVPRLPADSSILIPSTRWHEDDPSGRIQRGDLCAGMGWEHVSLPFLAHHDADGRRVPDTDGDSVLWPREQLPDGTWVGWTPEDARARLVSVGPYDAASIYQGQPRPRGGSVFRQPDRCAAPDIAGARFVLGCDPAGTDGPQSNHTVLVALAVRGYGDTATADVAGVLRLKLRPEHAAPQVLAWQRSFAGAPLHIESTRDGKDLATALRRIAPQIVIRHVAAIGDKFLRAQPAAAAWNATPARIRVPADARAMRSTTDDDLAAFVRVVTSFAGMGDREDDDVDALSHAWGACSTAATISTGHVAGI